MADAVFDFRREDPKRSLMAVGHEKGVVTEAAFPLLPPEQHSLDRTLKDSQQMAVPGEDKGALKPCPSLVGF